MMIDIYDVPNEMVYRYCRVIKQLEEGYNSHLERLRSELHNVIYDHVGCNRDLHTRKDRNFTKCFNIAVVELTYISGEYDTYE